MDPMGGQGNARRRARPLLAICAQGPLNGAREPCHRATLSAPKVAISQGRTWILTSRARPVCLGARLTSLSRPRGSLCKCALRERNARGCAACPPGGVRRARSCEGVRGGGGGGGGRARLFVFRVIEEISSAGGSMGWCTMIARAVPNAMGGLDVDGGRAIASPPADARLAGSIRPQG